ncbi:MAG: class II glutamine amidotransferase [Actinobacteria bacterium]|nr:class II glutamine amidotransferase [Actinomycetota bacterium]
MVVRAAPWPAAAGPPCGFPPAGTGPGPSTIAVTRPPRAATPCSPVPSAGGQTSQFARPSASPRRAGRCRWSRGVARPFVAHMRYATAGNRTLTNTHPFSMGGRIMAHNGGLGGAARPDLGHRVADHRPPPSVRWLRCDYRRKALSVGPEAGGVAWTTAR